MADLHDPTRHLQQEVSLSKQQPQELCTICLCFFSSLFQQLRVVKAFKSTLEDLEEKRSVHSFQSLHSIRSSRSHHGHRPISEEVNNHLLRTTSFPIRNQYASLHLNSPEAIVPVYQQFKTRSHSYESVPLVIKQKSPLLATTNPALKRSPPKTVTRVADVHESVTETSI